MASFSVLEQPNEDALHGTRLLTVEEKPFKRLTKRLLASNSPIQSFYSRLPTPPPEVAAEDDGVAATTEAAQQRSLEEHQRFREDVILDFAAFESSLARIQFLRTSNEKERERYNAEKLKIEATAQSVRDNTARLRIQLEEAQNTLAVRKTYDVLSDKITSNKALIPRDDQHVNLEKLRAEIEDLERESRDYSQAWAERREQFSRIVEEGMRLRRLLRDEKEEPEAQEGDDSLDAEEGRGQHSTIGTPTGERGGLTPMHPSQDSGTTTPRSMVRDIRGSSPPRDRVDQKKELQETTDTDMGDEGELEEPIADAPRLGTTDVVIEKPADVMDIT